MEKAFQKSRGLSGNQIKVIAIAAMTIDHVTWLLFLGFQKVWWVLLLHVIGRLTAPIMWFFIAEGFHYTHNVKKYILRLFVFSVISHFAYDFAGGIPFIPNGFFNMTSVMWSLAWSVVLMIIFTTDRLPQWLIGDAGTRRGGRKARRDLHRQPAAIRRADACLRPLRDRVRSLTR